jgi:hypothetical protein
MFNNLFVFSVDALRGTYDTDARNWDHHHKSKAQGVYALSHLAYQMT